MGNEIAGTKFITLPATLDCGRCPFSYDDKCLVFGDVKECERQRLGKSSPYNIGDTVFYAFCMYNFPRKNGKRNERVYAYKVIPVKIVGIAFLCGDGEVVYKCRIEDKDVLILQNNTDDKNIGSFNLFESEKDCWEDILEKRNTVEWTENETEHSHFIEMLAKMKKSQEEENGRQ